MNFLEALKTRRPIRRKAATLAYQGPWIVIGKIMGSVEQDSPWLRIDTGTQLTLARHDYLAEDWEAMP